MKKLIRITTVPVSLKVLLQGQLKYMSNYFDVLAVSSNMRELEELAAQEEVRTYAVDMTRSISPLKDFLSIIKLFLLFRKEKPDIVHTHTPKAGFAGMTAAWFARVPHRLHTIAGLPLEESKGFKRKLLLAVEKLTYRFAHHIYPNSKGLVDFIISNKLCPENKLKIIGNGSSNGIDTKYFSSNALIKAQALKLQDAYKINNDDFVFCFVGRIVKDKGIVELHKAFTSFVETNEKSKLILVGSFENELDPLPNDIIDSIKNNPKIIMAGYKNDIRPFLELADLFVFPSYREGFPNVVMQACCFNLPCIVTNIYGSNEIISNNINGLVIEKKNSNALYEAMKELANNPTLLKRFGENARDNIVEKYDKEKQWELIYEEYLRVLNIAK